MKKSIIISVIIISILAVIGSVLSKAMSKGEVLTVVRVQAPVRGNMVESIQAPGEIKPLLSVAISAKITGKLIALPYDEGDKVFGPDSGQEPSVLVKIDSSDLQADLESALARRDAQSSQIEVARIGIENSRANLKNTEISLAQAKRELYRLEELLKTNDVKVSDVENKADEVKKLELSLQSGHNSIKTAELNLSIMENNLKSADADIDKVKDALTYAVISSPLTGVVTQVLQEVGQIVTGATNYTGTTILNVADLSKMIMAAEIDEVDVGKVAVGQKAVVKIQAWPDESFAGVVTARSLVMQTGRSGTKYCQVEIQLDNTDGRIISGMTANAEIEIKVHDNVMKLPSQSVLGREWENLPKEIRDASADIIDKDKAFTPVVYAVIDGKTKVIPVKIGPSDLSDTIIEKGLKGDEKIIIGPFKELEAMTHDKVVMVEADKDEEQMADKNTEQTENGSESDPDKEVE
ncbi:MAG: efflux RND transporter periplasmic adaptor subunit [Sedimentisphaerales bacterium]|nr:efflux RND transporter periplasmic adaptor subunit [Sedimentisphaerales bacterium]